MSPSLGLGTAKWAESPSSLPLLGFGFGMWETYIACIYFARFPWSTDEMNALYEAVSKYYKGSQSCISKPPALDGPILINHSQFV